MSTRAQLEALGYSLPEIDGDIYQTANATIASGEAGDISISMGGIATANSITVTNTNTAGSGDDLYVRLNEDSNDIIIVPAGSSKQIDKFPVTSIHLSNRSSAIITYNIEMFGVSNT